jgi:hypothetical protein
MVVGIGSVAAPMNSASIVPMSIHGEVDYSILRRDGHGHHELGPFPASSVRSAAEEAGQVAASLGWDEWALVPTADRTHVVAYSSIEDRVILVVNEG